LQRATKQIYRALEIKTHKSAARKETKMTVITATNEATSTSACPIGQSIATIFLTGLLIGIAGGQTPPGVTAKAATTPPSAGAYDWFGRVGLACGTGASISTVALKPTIQCVGVFSMPFFEVETGVMGPQANQSSVSGYLSTNLWIPIPLQQRGNEHGVPLVVGGYTRMFETGHALDYGLAYAHPIDNSHSIQFELRDYWAFSNPSQHNVVFRMVWLLGLPD
jgi:hypothetical protein